MHGLFWVDILPIGVVRLLVSKGSAQFIEWGRETKSTVVAPESHAGRACAVLDYK